MVIDKGEKIHIVTRRNFEGDLRRHFVGEIVEAQDAVVRIEGYAFIWDRSRNEFAKKPDKRTTIIDLAESGYIVNILPNQVSIAKLIYKMSDQKHLTLTDQSSFTLDINEFGTSR
jgi:meiotically up-regulated gene 157 (Mug157) protein